MIKNMRKIPVTMATQHPDNACASPFSGNHFVSTTEEIDECYNCFSKLDVHEYMWDWEGKFVDEAVIDRLFSKYHDYFKENQLGKDIFLTFRIPNMWEEGHGKHRLPRSFMNAISAEFAAKNFSFHSTPIFEMILPMTTSGDQLIHLQQTFWKTAKAFSQIFSTESDLQEIEFIPLLEDVHTMTDISIADTYVDFLEHTLKKKPEYLRVFIARSDPAMNAGLIPTMLAVKAAISNYHEFGKRRGIKIYPWIGGGSLPFRGGVNPENADEIIDEYKGTASITIQSAFRSDYPMDTVTKAIRKFNTQIPKNIDTYKNVSKEELALIEQFNTRSAKVFQATIEPLAAIINELASNLPDRRERVQHVGLYGYARGDGTVKLPRAIKFTGAFYSLGVPPEYIATGRSLRIAKEMGMVDLVERLYVNLRRDLTHAGKYLNKENLALLSKDNESFASIAEDVKEIESYLGETLGPKTSRHMLHRNFVSNVYHLYRAGEDYQQSLLRAAEIRKSLG